MKRANNKKYVKTKKESDLKANICRNPKGITLVALVITIIVLLILASVAVVSLTGDNGIIKKAQEAKDKTEQSAKEEQNALDNILATMNQMGGTTATPPKPGEGGYPGGSYNDPYIPEGFKHPEGEGTWDTALRFIQVKTKKTEAEIGSNSTTWGNYSNSASPASVNGYGSLQVAGYSEYWKARKHL